MEIEYLKEFEKLYIVNRDQKEVDAIMHRFKVRHAMCRKYSFAIPTKETVEAIAKFSPILELGAGSGYWASLLTKSGAKVEAFDKFQEDNKYKFTKRHYEVKTGSEEILKDISKEYSLFLCWPNYDNDFAYNALKLFKGQTLIYIGEPEGGCTGNGKFHNLLKKKWNLVDKLSIPQWDGIHDLIMIHTRK